VSLLLHAGGRRLEELRGLQAERDGLATDRDIAEMAYTMGGTEKAFRLIGRRWPNPQPRFLGVNTPLDFSEAGL
jgi:hypothetical protein